VTSVPVRWWLTASAVVAAGVLLAAGVPHPEPAVAGPPAPYLDVHGPAQTTQHLNVEMNNLPMSCYPGYPLGTPAPSPTTPTWEQTIRALWDGLPTASEQVTSEYVAGGVLTGTIDIVPLPGAPGGHTLQLSCPDPVTGLPTAIAATTVYLTGGTMSATSGPAGTAVHLSVVDLPADCGYLPDANVRVLWDRDLSSPLVPVWGPSTFTTYPSTPDSYTVAGLDLTVTVPAMASAGNHAIVLQCSISDSFLDEWITSFHIPAKVTAGPPTRTPSRSPSPSPLLPPSPPPSPSPSPVPTLTNVAPTAAGVPDTPSRVSAGPRWPRPLTVAAIPRWTGLPRSPLALGLSLLVVAVLMFLLVGWPAELFNKTFDANEELIRRWFRLRPPRQSSGRRTWLVVACFSLLSASVMSVAEPGPFLNRRMLTVAAALAVAVPLTAVSFEWAIESYVRRVAQAGPIAAPRLHIVYPAVVVAAACAVASRLLHFVPGYAYGLIIAYPVVSGRVLRRSQDAVGVLRGALAMFGLGVLSWLVWQFATSGPASSDTAGLGLRLVDTTLGFTALLSVETLLICLLPLRFMPGVRIWRWAPRGYVSSATTWRGRLLWVACYSTAATTFGVVLLGIGERTPSWPEVVAMLELLVGFCVVSIAFWAFFAVRRRLIDPA
jgi:hypothetical protein